MKEQNTKDIQSNMFMLCIKIFAWCTIISSIGWCCNLYLKTRFIDEFSFMAEFITYMGGAFIIFIISDESKKNLNKLQKFSLYFMLSASLLQMILYQNYLLFTTAAIRFLALFPALIVLLTIRKKELKLINMPFFFIFSFFFSIIFNGKFVFLGDIINLPTALNNIIEIILFTLPTIYFLCTMDYYLKFKTPKVRFYTVLFSILCFINIFMLCIKMKGVAISDNLFGFFKLSILASAVYIAYKQKDDFIRLIKGNSKLIKENTKHEE